MQIVTMLRQEINRLSKRVVKAETNSTRKAVNQHRKEIARLKRQIAIQAREIHALKNHLGEEHGASFNESEQRYTRKSVAKERTRLKLSRREFGILVGVSDQTIYSWETGRTRPRPQQMDQIFAVRKLGRREATAKIAAQHKGKGNKKIVKFRKAS